MQAQQERIQATPARVPYRTPKLVKYGKLASLVQGGTGSPGPETSFYFSNFG